MLDENTAAYALPSAGERNGLDVCVVCAGHLAAGSDGVQLHGLRRCRGSAVAAAARSARTDAYYEEKVASVGQGGKTRRRLHYQTDKPHALERESAL